MTNPPDLLRSLFDVAVAAARPAVRMPPFLPPPPRGRIVAVGAGKAAAEMARIVSEHYGDEVSGLVVTRYGHRDPALSTGRIEVVEAGHPVPDRNGMDAARQILERVRGLGAADLVLCLLSGGGSALLSLPAPGLTLDDKQAVTRDLLRCGAAIDEINCVRKHLSAIKGGQLADAAYPAPVLTLAISDVVGDDLSVIASGPTVPDPSTFADATAILERFRIVLPPAVARHLAAAGEETPKPGDPRFAGSRAVVVASPRQALEAAARRAGEAAYEAVVLGDDIEGEAREVGTRHAALALEYRAAGRRVAILSGGETTVTLRGNGRGGPNGEYALALAIALAGEPGISAIACDTDGIDGSEDNAGAVVLPDTLARAGAAGVDAADRLAANDSYGFFSATGGLVLTGPTSTNVNDFRAILVGRPEDGA
jgi:glycerate 2-kinase